MGNTPLVVVLRRKMPIVESNVLVLYGSVLTWGCLGLILLGKHYGNDF